MFKFSAPYCEFCGGPLLTNGYSHRPGCATQDVLVTNTAAPLLEARVVDHTNARIAKLEAECARWKGMWDRLKARMVSLYKMPDVEDAREAYEVVLNNMQQLEAERPEGEK